MEINVKHLLDRPCSVCEFHKENGCCKWSCVFEQESILDKISAEIWELYSYVEFDEDIKTSFNMVRLEEVQRVIDKYKAESEDTGDK